MTSSNSDVSPVTSKDNGDDYVKWESEKVEKLITKAMKRFKEVNRSIEQEMRLKTPYVRLFALQALAVRVLRTINECERVLLEKSE